MLARFFPIGLLLSGCNMTHANQGLKKVMVQ